MSTTGLIHAYNSNPTVFVRGQGARLWDETGKEYLDALAGIAVCGLGHCHPAITQVIAEQAGTLMHTSNLFSSRAQQELAQSLADLSGMERMFFCNSGAEANEAAIKISRKYGHQLGIDKPVVITMEGSFHGRTMATLSATGNKKIREGFAPLVETFITVPYNDVAAIEKIAGENPNVVAILVEPVQGEGGINIPAADYLNRLREICDQHNWLLMLDEIQSGMGRTGTFFCYQHNGILPDVVTVAKGLGNGFPIGACLTQGKAAEVIQPGNHGSTFGGNILACRTAETVLKVLQNENLMPRAEQLGKRIVQGLKQGLAQHPLLKEVRGKGLMIGIELSKPCGELVAMALERGLVINVTNENRIRLLPALIISEAEADQIVEILVALLKDYR